MQLAQSACSNPGTFASTNGSQYEYNTAVNTYQECLVITASTPTPTVTPTVTVTPTLMPTPAAVQAQTGCNPYDAASLYQLCVINDANTRQYTFTGGIFIPLIFFAIIIFGVLRFGRHN